MTKIRTFSYGPEDNDLINKIDKEVSDTKRPFGKVLLEKLSKCYSIPIKPDSDYNSAIANMVNTNPEEVIEIITQLQFNIEAGQLPLDQVKKIQKELRYVCHGIDRYIYKMKKYGRALSFSYDRSKFNFGNGVGAMTDWELDNLKRKQNEAMKPIVEELKKKRAQNEQDERQKHHDYRDSLRSKSEIYGLESGQEVVEDEVVK